jgi:hypothetical protein
MQVLLNIDNGLEGKNVPVVNAVTGNLVQRQGSDGENVLTHHSVVRLN